MSEYNKLTDEEFDKMMRLLDDSDTVGVGYLKDVLRQLRNNGNEGKDLSGEALVLFTDMMLKWMVDDVMSRRLVN